MTALRDMVTRVGTRSGGRRARRRALLAGGIGAATALGLVAQAGATTHPAAVRRTGPAVRFSYAFSWQRDLAGPVGESSPAPITIDGVPSLVVGTTTGNIYAVSLRTGALLPGWPITVPGSLPVESTASVNGSAMYFGLGDAADPDNGGYLALGAKGAVHWFRQVPLVPGGSVLSGVSASLAFGRLQGASTVTAGSLGQALWSLRSSDGVPLGGFPFQSTDTEFATPAIAAVRGGSTNYIIEGATQTGGEAYGTVWPQGGHLWVIRPTGTAGTGKPDGGAVCDFEPDEVVDSSPAVGGVLAGHATAIVFGTGTEFAGASDENAVFAMTPGCAIAWKATLDGGTASSPALVGALGNGRLQVAEAASTGADSGTVYLLAGTDGHVLWTRNVVGGIIGSVTSANLGGGYQDILVPTTTGLYLLDGRSGAVIGTLALHQLILQNSALVTDDPNGKLGITIAGQTGPGVGVIRHYVLERTNGKLVAERGAWPEFHHDPHLTGSTLPPVG